jgi:hypothetical protein
MMSADESRPGAGSGRRGAKSEKPEKKTERSKKAEKKQRKSEKSERKPDVVLEAPQVLPEPPEQIEPPIVVAESSQAVALAIDEISHEPAKLAPAPVSVSTITDAYGSYTKKSLEQTSSFFEQLAGTRSLNRAFELQTDFARQTFETFVAESRKLRELHRELAKQRLNSFEGFVMGRRATRST